MMKNQNTDTMNNNTDLSPTALTFVPRGCGGGGGGGGNGGSGGGGASAPRSHAPSRAGGRTSAKDCSVCRRTFKNRSELEAHLAFTGHRTVRRYAFRFKAAAGGGFKGVCVPVGETESETDRDDLQPILAPFN